MGLGRQEPAALQLHRIHRPFTGIPIRDERQRGQHARDARNQCGVARQRHRPEPGLLRAVAADVERFRGQLDLPVRQEQHAAACSSSSSRRTSPKTSTTAGYEPAVHLRRYAGGPMRAVPGDRTDRSGQHEAARLCVLPPYSALPRPAQRFGVRLAAGYPQESVSCL